MKKQSLLVLPVLFLTTFAHARSAWLECGPRDQSVVSIEIPIQEDGTASLNQHSLNLAPVQLHFLNGVALATQNGPLPQSFKYDQASVVSLRKNVKLSEQGTLIYGLYHFQNSGMVVLAEGPVFLSTRILKPQSIDLHSGRVQGAAEVQIQTASGETTDLSCDFWIPWI